MFPHLTVTDHEICASNGENILVVGIMPGPNEPSGNINMYLEPLICDMEKLWDGVMIKVKGRSVKVRAAISCLACDVPAARKDGGFIGHRGYHSCNKCYKTFPTAQFGDYPAIPGLRVENHPACDAKK